MSKPITDLPEHPPTTPESASLRDDRRSHHFWVDDVVIDRFGAELGVYGIAVYVYLARRAKASKSFPSIRRIAKELDCSIEKVRTTLKTLQNLALISIESRQSDQGDADTNVYTLCDLSPLWGGVLPGGGGVLPGSTRVLPGGGGVLPHGGGVCYQVVQKDSLKKDLKPENKLLTSFGVPDVSETPDTSASLVTSTPALPVEAQHRDVPKAPQSLDPEDWLTKLLARYDDRFDVQALNDNAWWTDLANSFPTFSEPWVDRAFADLARWLTDNPQRVPRSSRGWKMRLRYSLNRFYDIDQRRASYGQTNQTRPSRRSY